MKDQVGIQVENFKLQGDEMSVGIRFTDKYPLFSGHFEGEPILPGVALIETSVQLLSGGSSLSNISIHKCRFAQVVRPNDPLVVSGVKRKGSWNLQWNQEGSDKKLVAQVNVTVE